MVQQPIVDLVLLLILVLMVSAPHHPAQEHALVLDNVVTQHPTDVYAQLAIHWSMESVQSFQQDLPTGWVISRRFLAQPISLSQVTHYQ